MTKTKAATKTRRTETKAVAVVAVQTSFDPTEKAILASLSWAILIGLTFIAIGWNWTEISGWLYHAVGHAPTIAHGAAHNVIHVASR